MKLKTPQIRRDWVKQNLATHHHLCAHFGTEPDESTALGLVDRLFPPAWTQAAVGNIDTMMLYDTVRALRPSSIIEIGTASGISTCAMALALLDSGCSPTDAQGNPRITTLDLHTHCFFDRTRTVGSAIAELSAPAAQCVRICPGCTSTDLPRLMQGHTADFAFIDGDHRHPMPALDLLWVQCCMTPGSWIALHDIALPRLLGRDIERGAAALYSWWPFEKTTGLPAPTGSVGGDNLGLIRLPPDEPITASLLAPLLNQPWETTPPPTMTSLLEAAA